MSSAVAVLLGSLLILGAALIALWLFHPRRYHAPHKMGK